MYSLKSDSENFENLWASINKPKQEQLSIERKEGYNKFYNTRMSIPNYQNLDYTNKAKVELDYINRQPIERKFKISKNSESKESLNFKEQYNNKDYYTSLTTKLNSYNNDSYSNFYSDRKFNSESLKSSIEKQNSKFYNIADYHQQKDLFKLYKNRASEANYIKKAYQNVNDSKNVYSSMTSSDIFNNKPNDIDIIKKSGEKSLNFKVNKPYTSNSASNSSWIPSHSKMTLFNHTNQPYHILNPLIKTTSYIKDDIIKKENNEKLTHRQKGICEFVDITRNGSPKPNREFIQIYKTEKSPFNKTKNICSDFASMSHDYHNLCGPAFGKKNFN